MRMSKSPSAYCRVAAAISRMGLICRMVVMEDAIKEIISTTKPVIISSPAKARHRLSTESEAQTVNTAPRTSPVVGFTTDTPPTNCLLE